ncbi:MAG: hypothetical protein HY096_03095 [Nitrospinae bacterium]|nr:hypothetical protein [Nitrospinota bacterium]
MKKFIPLFFFTVAFAYIESAVVVYLRELYYPEGFKFPLKLIPSNIGLIEVGREAATLVMITTIGLIAGKTRWQKVSYSIFVFGIWDIFYYVWLKIFLNWPESLFTWDILFLIPVPWIAPVLAPITVAITISIASMIVVYLENQGRAPLAGKKDIAFIIIGAIIILISFILDFRLLTDGGAPDNYHWEFLAAGELIGLWAFINIIKK